MKLVADLRTLVVAAVDPDVTVMVNSIEQDATLPFVFIEEQGSNTDLCFSGAACLTESDFVIEIVSEDLGEAIEIAGDIKGALNGHRGDLTEDKYCNYIEAEETGADYIPRTMADDGRNIKSLSVHMTTDLRS